MQKPLSEGELDTGNQTQKWAEVSISHVYSAFKDSHFLYLLLSGARVDFA